MVRMNATSGAEWTSLPVTCRSLLAEILFKSCFWLGIERGLPHSPEKWIEGREIEVLALELLERLIMLFLLRQGGRKLLLEGNL